MAKPTPKPTPASNQQSKLIAPAVIKDRFSKNYGNVPTQRASNEIRAVPPPAPKN
jgi:hypothetical protein